MRRHLIPILVVAALTGAAQADVVAPPPTTCPEGTTPSTCHGGAYCGVRNCQTDGDCTAGTVCKDLNGCWGSITCGGMYVGRTDVYNPPHDVFMMACPDTDSCANGKPCQSLKVCMPPGTGSATKSAVTTSTGIASSTNSRSGTASATRTGTGVVTSSQSGTGTGTRTANPTGTATSQATATAPQTATAVTTAISTASGATLPNTATGTGTSATTAVISTATDTGSNRQTGVATSNTSGTGMATATGTNTPDVKLGKNGCDCDVGGWMSAKALGPWMLAGVFGATVLLFRRRRR